MCCPWASGVLIGVQLFIAVFVSVAEGADAKASDRKLIAAVKAAAVNGLQPAKVETAVGVKATLNTLRKPDRDSFSRADIVPDPDNKPRLPARDSLRWVVYWVRPIEGRNPKLVGIFWPKEGKPQVFFGEILPPR
jgi:hypothetical protein